MAKFRKRERICRCCGGRYMSGGGRSLYCARCSAIVSSAISSLYSQGVPAGPERVSQAVAIAKRKIQIMEDYAVIEDHVCKTCGQTFKGPRSAEFCQECVEQGLDRLHEYTGWTNGWDRKLVEHVEAKDGWRGRPVAGGCGHNRRIYDIGSDC